MNYFPKYFSSKAITLYLAVLVVCNIVFFSHNLSILWWIFGIIEVLGFFYFSNKLTRQWSTISPKKFVSKLFQIALIIRILWVVFSYFFYTIMTGKPFEFDAADAVGYHVEAEWLVAIIKTGNLQPYFDYINGKYSDMGYPFYLGWQYWITGSSIFIARLLKAFYSAYMCVLLYRLATRNFGETVGRIAGIFCMLMPNLILYTGLHVKEAEMVFLTVLFMERADYLIRSKNYTFITIAIPLVLAGSLFFFRTVLGAAVLFALFTTIFFSSSKVLGFGKRTMLIVWGVVAASYFVGGKIATEIETVWRIKNTNQETSLQMRTTRENGNKLAKYASSVIFVPMIFIIPYPTLVNTPGQENQKIINGGNFVKNILAFFVLFSFYWVIKNNKWRDYTLIISFTAGYLLVIANSAFAQSERFHQPALPFLLIMAAFGFSKITNSHKKYFSWYMGVIFITIVVWSWYKLAGRGLT